MPQFRAAAGMAAQLELQIRLLADKAPSTRAVSLDAKLENVEDAVVRHFGTALSAADIDLIKICRRLRNKLFHIEFWAAREKMAEHGIDFLEVSVTLVEFATGATQPVAETRGPGTLYGWFLEMGACEAFEEAEHLFTKAIVVMERLALSDLSDR
jgi:hypothetical protein